MGRGGIAARNGRYKDRRTTSQRIAGVSRFETNRVGTQHRCSLEVWAKICDAVKQRDGHRCCQCGANPNIDHTVLLTVDHIIPHSRGGNDLPSNLRTLCLTCHKKRIGRANRRGSKLLERRFGNRR